MTTENHMNFSPEKSPELLLRKTYYSNMQSEEDIRAICQKHNITDASQAIRSALHWYAQSEMAPQLPAPIVRRGRPAKTG